MAIEIYVDFNDENDPRKLLREPTIEELMKLVAGSRFIEFYSGDALIREQAHNRFYPQDAQTHLTSFASEYLSSKCVCFRDIDAETRKVATELT